MAYVTIPKDLTKVKSKVLFGLTKRQLICFGAAALIGVPLFFLLRRTASNSAAAFCMIIVMLPFFLLAMYERHANPWKWWPDRSSAVCSCGRRNGLTRQTISTQPWSGRPRRKRR